jgi:hypothetical protein
MSRKTNKVDSDCIGSVYPWYNPYDSWRKKTTSQYAKIARIYASYKYNIIEKKYL